MVKKTKKGAILFDKEVVTKTDTVKPLNKEPSDAKNLLPCETIIQNDECKKKKKRKRTKKSGQTNNKQQKIITESNLKTDDLEKKDEVDDLEKITKNIENTSSDGNLKKKRKRPLKETVVDEENTNETPEPKSSESIRKKKQKRHEELVQSQKLKSELQLQQKCLNYLSQWKHNKEFWKFEKLRQIWLQKNIYNETKIPQEHWNTLLEYFSGTKGKCRLSILNEALKIVEEDSEETVKFLRARDIVQTLQE